jgi:hypothetical protein
MRLSRVAGRAVSSPVIRRFIAPRVSRALRQNSQIAYQVLGESVPLNLDGKRPNDDTCSEAITYDMLMPIFEAVREVAGQVAVSSDMDFSGAIAYFRMQLEEMKAADPELLNRIDDLEDPLARGGLRMIIANKERWLALCAYLESEGIGNINQMMKRAPDIMERVTDAEREIIRDLLTPDDAPVIQGIIQVTKDVYSALRRGE